VKWKKCNSWDFSSEFSGFYHTSNFLRILRILLHLRQLSYKTNQHKRLENSPFSRNLVTTKRKRRRQGGVLWTEDHKRSDANYIAWINLIQSNTTDRAKLGLMKAQEGYIDTSTAQSSVPGLFGGFSFRCLKKLKGGDSWIHSTAQRKEHSKTEFEKKNSENEFGESETFYRSKFSNTGRTTKFAPGKSLRFFELFLELSLFNFRFTVFFSVVYGVDSWSVLWRATRDYLLWWRAERGVVNAENIEEKFAEKSLVLFSRILGLLWHYSQKTLRIRILRRVRKIQRLFREANLVLRPAKHTTSMMWTFSHQSPGYFSIRPVCISVPNF